MVYKFEFITQAGTQYNEYLNGELNELINLVLTDEEYSCVKTVTIYSVDEVPKDGEEEKNKRYIKMFEVYREIEKFNEFIKDIKENPIDKEFAYILNFIDEEILDISYYFNRVKNKDDYESEIIFRQLRSLWTTYCMHEDLMPDTLEYDVNFKQVYNAIAKELPIIPYESFDLFMGGNLA